MKVQIGSIVEDASIVEIDIASLISSRLVIQASSDQGKSWTIRMLVERVAPSVPVIILDIEGEYASVASEIGAVVLGEGGHAGLTVGAARDLAKALRAARISAVLDLSEFTIEDRQRFVAGFIESLMACPKSMWKPAVVVIDEAHTVCPEGGDIPSSRPVADLMSRGRKRGLCGWICTQRISKLGKDAVAECRNWMIGGTSLDIDQKRAADMLGVPPRQRAELARLDRGQFWCFGPSFSTRIPTIVQMDKPKTRPAKDGGVFEPVKSAAIEGVVAKIAKALESAPKEGEPQDFDAALAENRSLRARVEALESEPRAEANGALDDARNAIKIRDEALDRYRAHLQRFHDAIAETIGPALSRFRDVMQGVVDDAARDSERVRELLDQLMSPPHAVEIKPVAALAPSRPKPAPAPRPAIAAPGSDHEAVNQPRADILRGLAWFETVGIRAVDRANLAAIVGVSHRSSGFKNNLSTLRGAGLIDYPTDGQVSLTDQGAKAAPRPERPTSLASLHEAWMASSALSGPQRDMLGVVIQYHPRQITRENLAEHLGVSWKSSGFKNNVSHLRGLGLIDYPTNGVVVATPILFPEALR